MNKYKIKGLPWSLGIGRDVTDCTTSAEVMEKAGLNFTVKKCELVARMPMKLSKESLDALNLDEKAGDFIRDRQVFRTCPDAYATYRTDLGIPLGIVKSKYTVIQNQDAFSFFDNVIKCGQAEWQNAGMFGLGHKIFVTAKLPGVIKVGNQDPIDDYLVFSNAHDGTSSVNILFTPIRVFCTNCLAAAKKNADAFIRIRHTKSANQKLDIGTQIIRGAIEHSKNIGELYNYLATIQMTDAQVQEYIAKVNMTEDELAALHKYDRIAGIRRIIGLDYPTLEASGVSTKKANKMAAMYKYYMEGVAQSEIIGTAWGAYNAITGYYCNVAPFEGEKRMDSLLYGSSAKVMCDALTDVLEYANA